MVLWLPGEECFSLGVDIVRALVSRCSLSTARLKIKCAADRGGSRFWLRVCSVAGAVGLVPRSPGVHGSLEDGIQDLKPPVPVDSGGPLF